MKQDSFILDILLICLFRWMERLQKVNQFDLILHQNVINCLCLIWISDKDLRKR